MPHRSKWASTILNAYIAELFPTSHRSTAESAIAVAGTLGGSAGLMMESWIYVTVGNHWRAVSLLMIASVAITVAIFFLRPRAASSIRFPPSAAAYRAAIAAAPGRKSPPDKTVLHNITKLSLRSANWIR